MSNTSYTKLERLGLSPMEAQIYVTLLRKGGPLGATALAEATGVQRTTVYPILTSLTEKGMIEAGAGYGSRFSAIRPDEAFSSLIARGREELLQRERVAEEELLQRKRVADELAKQLESVAKWTDNNGEAELIQILRDPRVIAARFERLQLEAEKSIDVFTKAPLFISPGNPAQAKAQSRGVHCRGLYERAVLDTPGIKPHLAIWIAHGEEARVYDGELPHKLAIFDRQTVLMPLVRPGAAIKTILVRHPQLAQSLTLAFEHLWERSEPLSAFSEKATSFTLKPVIPRKQRVSPNSRVGQSAKR